MNWTRLYAMVLVALLAFAGSANAGTDRFQTEHERGPGSFLIGYTLIFPDELGQEHLIHFSRFGTFDWYFPCQFETGSWELDADRVLRLTYDSSQFAPRTYKLAHREDGITLTEPGGENTTVARVEEGNRLPYG